MLDEAAAVLLSVTAQSFGMPSAKRQLASFRLETWATAVLTAFRLCAMMLCRYSKVQWTAFTTWLSKCSAHPAVIVTCSFYTQRLQFCAAVTAGTLCNFMECASSKTTSGWSWKSWSRAASTMLWNAAGKNASGIAGAHLLVSYCCCDANLLHPYHPYYYISSQ